MTRVRRAPRHSRRTIAFVGLWTVTVGLYSVFVPVHAALYGTPVALAFLLGAAVCGALPLSIARPRTAIVVFCTAVLIVPLVTDTALAATAPWPWSVPATLAFVGLVGLVTGIHGARPGLLLLVLALVASLTAPLLRPDIIETANVAATATADLIVTASVAVAAFLLALLIASRLRIGVELTREREHSALEESRRALIEERTRIARELHDVIAHSMSVIQVQASTRITVEYRPARIAAFRPTGMCAAGLSTRRMRSSSAASRFAISVVPSVEGPRARISSTGTSRSWARTDCTACSRYPRSFSTGMTKETPTGGACESSCCIRRSCHGASDVR